MELKGSFQKVGQSVHKAWNWTERRLLVPENAGLASAGLPTYMPRRPQLKLRQPSQESQSREQILPPSDKYAHYWDPNALAGGMAVRQTSELSFPCETDNDTVS